MVNPKLVIAVAVIGTILGLGVYECRQQRVVVQEGAAAAHVHQQAASHEAEAKPQDQQADTHTPIIKAKTREIAALRAEIDRLKKSAPADLAPIVATQGTLIEVQGQKIGALEVQGDALASARDSWRSAATDYKAEAEHLQTALKHTPSFHPLAAGLIKGSMGTIGIGVEYDISRLRLGADLTSRPVTGHSSPETEVLARVFWRF